MEFVKLELNEALATLTIDRPKALNALNPQVLSELLEALEKARGSRGAIITGAGEKAFVAGADIAQLSELTPAMALEAAALGHQVCDAIAALPFPVIAAVNGFALGGGCELALACDLIYASERAKFGLPEVTLGVIPGWGGTQRLARRIGPARAAELIFTGDIIDAVKAKEVGLALEVLAADKLMPHCREVLGRIAKRGPLAVSAAKRVIAQGLDLALSEGCSVERHAFSELFATTDQREGMKAFLEKRPAAFTGA
jgi:enoyl-CoA hydratase